MHSAKATLAASEICMEGLLSPRYGRRRYDDAFVMKVTNEFNFPSASPVRRLPDIRTEGTWIIGKYLRSLK